MLMLAIYVGRLRGTLDIAKAHKLVEGLHDIPEQIHKLLENVDQIKVFCNPVMAAVKMHFFLGPQLDYAVALEGALKLKEISYIHAEGFMQRGGGTN
mgnify:CR=1 FL=1